MVEVRNPRVLAEAIEIELARFRHVERVFRVPPVLCDEADALERVASMLREADHHGQAVDLGDEVMRLIQGFQGALRAVGGAPAQA